MEGNGIKIRQRKLVRLHECGFTQTTELWPTVGYMKLCVDGYLNCRWHLVICILV